MNCSPLQRMTRFLASWRNPTSSGPPSMFICLVCIPWPNRCLKRIDRDTLIPLSTTFEKVKRCNRLSSQAEARTDPSGAQSKPLTRSRWSCKRHRDPCHSSWWELWGRRCIVDVPKSCLHLWEPDTSDRWQIDKQLNCFLFLGALLLWTSCL